MPELPEVETVRRGLAPVMEGARFKQVEARRGDLRWPLPKDFVKRIEGHSVQRARPARQISARGSVVRRGAADASRHVGLVPRAQRRRCDARRLLSRARKARRARPHRVPHVERRHHHLQRSAPLRLHETGRAGKARRGAAAARARAGAARQRLRRRHAGAGLPRQEDLAESRAVRPAHRRRARQHLCLRGAAPRAAVAQAPRLDHRDAHRRAQRSRGAAGRGHPRWCSTTPSRPAARRCATTA